MDMDSYIINIFEPPKYDVKIPFPMGITKENQVDNGQIGQKNNKRVCSLET